MKLSHLKPEAYVTTRWAGGTTTQLAIAPPDALYADRDFLWRVSSAAVELEESDFTALPDYLRYISNLRGEMRLNHDGGPSLTLVPGQVHAFDGAARTHSWGRCTDFNLMLRKGRAAGDLRSLRTDKGGVTAAAERETVLLYCDAGGSVRAEGETVALAPGEALLLEDAKGVGMDLTGQSLWMLAQITLL